MVEDDTDLRESIAEILAHHHYQVACFEDAESALCACKITVPILVIVDNMMPGMSGMALVPVLKQHYPTVKIIMITAFSTIDNAVAAMKSGANDYLAKPFKRDELLVAVQRSLEELKFEKQLSGPGMDEALSCLSNQIRRDILQALLQKGDMRFMDITRHLKISDHTKVNFHLKNLRTNNLVSKKREKLYGLTPQGRQLVDALVLLSKKISF